MVTGIKITSRQRLLLKVLNFIVSASEITMAYQFAAIYTIRCDIFDGDDDNDEASSIDTSLYVSQETETCDEDLQHLDSRVG